MKLKTLTREVTETKYEIIVYDKKGYFITAFIVNYLAADGKDNILRKCAIQDNAIVSSIYVNPCNGILTIHVRVEV